MFQIRSYALVSVYQICFACEHGAEARLDGQSTQTHRTRATAYEAIGQTKFGVRDRRC